MVSAQFCRPCLTGFIQRRNPQVAPFAIEDGFAIGAVASAQCFLSCWTIPGFSSAAGSAYRHSPLEGFAIATRCPPGEIRSDALDLPLCERHADALRKVVPHLGQPHNVGQGLLLGLGI